MAREIFMDKSLTVKYELEGEKTKSKTYGKLKEEAATEDILTVANEINSLQSRIPMQILTNEKNLLVD